MQKKKSITIFSKIQCGSFTMGNATRAGDQATNFVSYI